MPNSDRQQRAGRPAAWLRSITRPARRALARRVDPGTYTQLEQVSEARQAAAEDARELGRAYRDLLAEIQGRGPAELGPAPTAPPPAQTLAHDLDLAAQLRRWARIVERIIEGDTLESAVVDLVRDRIEAKRNAEVRPLVQSLVTRPGGAAAGYLGSALIAADMNLVELAWAYFDRSPAELRLRLTGSEYFQTAFLVDPRAALAEARRVLAESDHAVTGAEAESRELLSPRAWLDLVGYAFGAGEPGLAAELFDHVHRLAERTPQRWEPLSDELAWLRPWVEPAAPAAGLSPADAGAPAADTGASDPADELVFAIMDYRHPNPRLTGVDLGDYFGSLAALGQLARHRNLRFADSDGLGILVAELQDRITPDRQLDTPARFVRLVPVNRDVSSSASLTEPTWLIAAGSHQHSLARLRYDFPYHAAIRPIFISFHCERPAMLTEPAIEYLRRYSPVGCRDWSTVHLLLSIGVPAFFSGCITSTLGTPCPPPDPRERPADGAPVGYDQTAPPPGAPDAAVGLRPPAATVRAASLAGNLRTASSVLSAALRDYTAIAASRLSWYLSTRSIGAPARFTPPNPAEPELSGLLDVDGAGLTAMRDGIEVKLAAVTSAIFRGEAEDAVYARWRELCADDVASARRRHQAALPELTPSFELAPLCAAVRAGEVVVDRTQPAPAGPEVHVALALDGNLKRQLAVHLEGLVRYSSRPLHLWMLVRDHDESDYARLSDLFPTVTYSWLPCDPLEHGVLAGVPAHITPSTLDRLLLPDLLPDLDRIVYLDIDTLPLADVAELYDWELDGDPLAARSAVARHVVSGFAEIYRSARALSDRPDDAHELVRRSHTRHRYDFTHFNAGVLVLDLARMRKDGFCAQVIGGVERYALNDQQALNWYAGPHRAVLPPAWNARPTQEVVTDPRLIHWAGVQKPWNREYVLLREYWQRYEADLLARAGSTPDPLAPHSGSR
ncbi:MAG: glycosyltransferase [Actinomycetes bacterium]